MKRILVLFLSSLAWAQELGGLAPLLTHPLRLQALAQVEAARAQRLAQSSPIALQAQGGYGLLGYTCASPEACQSLPSSATSLTLHLALTPFPFGEVAEGVRRAELGLKRAELGYIRTVLALLAQAYRTRGRLEEAERGLRFAEAGLDLAKEALQSVRKRFMAGGASEREVREREAQLREALEARTKAEEGVFLARLSAEGLLDPTLPLPSLPPPRRTTPLRAVEAELALEEARLDLDGFYRNLLPTLQVELALYPSEKERLSLGLNTRTLQPTLSYTHQNPAQTGSLPGARLDREVRLGLALTLSPGLFEGLRAAEAQAKALEEALRAARLQAQVEEEALWKALSQREREVRLKEEAYSDKAKALEEAKARLQLGLESPLGVREKEVALLQADLERTQAKNALLGALLDLYSFYGAIPFEALFLGR